MDLVACPVAWRKLFIDRPGCPDPAVADSSPVNVFGAASCGRYLYAAYPAIPIPSAAPTGPPRKSIPAPATLPRPAPSTPAALPRPVAAVPTTDAAADSSNPADATAVAFGLLDFGGCLGRGGFGIGRDDLGVGGEGLGRHPHVLGQGRERLGQALARRRELLLGLHAGLPLLRPGCVQVRRIGTPDPGGGILRPGRRRRAGEFTELPPAEPAGELVQCIRAALTPGGPVLGA